SWNDVDRFARRVPDGLHLAAAQRTDAKSQRNRVGHLDARDPSGKLSAASTAVRPLRSWWLLCFRCRSRLGAGHDKSRQRQGELALETMESFGAWTFTCELRETLGQLQVDVAHASDEGHDGDDDLDKFHRREHLLEPLTKLVEVWNVGRRGRPLHSRY